MTNKNIKNKVLDYIKNHNATSFVEIERVFEEHNFDYKGDGAYTSGAHQNVIFWTGWNEQAFNVVAELKKDGYIEIEPCPLLIYLTDGKCLNLPVMQKVSDAKHDCWLPITFSVSKVS